VAGDCARELSQATADADFTKRCAGDCWGDLRDLWGVLNFFSSARFARGQFFVVFLTEKTCAAVVTNTRTHTRGHIRKTQMFSGAPESFSAGVCVEVNFIESINCQPIAFSMNPGRCGRAVRGTEQCVCPRLHANGPRRLLQRFLFFADAERMPTGVG
jgi:hypothetical protein